MLDNRRKGMMTVMSARKRNDLSPKQITDIISQLQELEYKGHKIRVMCEDGQQWIVFTDICKALGYKNSTHESKKVRPEEKCKLEIGLKNTLAVCINRAGLLSFTLFANKPKATAFREWAEENIFCNGAKDSKMLDSEIIELFRQLLKDKKDEFLRMCEEMVYQNSSGEKV